LSSKKIRASRRILTIAEGIANYGYAGVVYDIGADHAYLPIYLIGAGLCGSAVATDVSPPSLARARRNAAEFGLSDKISFCLGDGFSAIDDYKPGNIVVVAGIGGKNLIDILQRGLDKAGAASLLILQPMNSHELLREWLVNNDFNIDCERLAREEYRIYSVMFCRPGVRAPRPYSPVEIYAGRNVIYGDADEYRHFLRFTKRKILNRYEGLSVAGGGGGRARPEQDALGAVLKEIDALMENAVE